jgi:hypothetical protein
MGVLVPVGTGVGVSVDVAVGAAVAVAGHGVMVGGIVAVGALAVARSLAAVACARATVSVARASWGVSVCAIAVAGMATINTLINVATMHLMLFALPRICYRLIDVITTLANAIMHVNTNPAPRMIIHPQPFSGACPCLILLSP